MDEFLDFLGIDYNLFDYCVFVVGELDKDLYDKYYVKRQSDKQKCFDNIIGSFREIIDGINSGKLSNDADFTILEFWKLLPMIDGKYSKRLFSDFRRYNSKLKTAAEVNFIRRIEQFIITFFPNEFKIILKYLNDNNISNYSAREINESFLEMNYSINGRFITPKIHDLIIKYIDMNNLPLIRDVYIEVFKLYLDGKIDLENVKDWEIKQKVVLLP